MHRLSTAMDILRVDIITIIW